MEIEQESSTTNEKKPCAKWYIASAVNGNEVSAVKNLQAKVKAIHYEDLILDVKLIMNKFVQNIYFDENDPNNKPPKSMKNTTNITWSVLGNGKYKKQIVKLENKFPGYIFVKMIMTDESWYAVRNSPKITGLVGSSGAGIKPQPIDNEEVETILNNTQPFNSYAVIVDDDIVTDERYNTSFAGDHFNTPEGTTAESRSDGRKNTNVNHAQLADDFKIGNTVVVKIGDETMNGVIVSIDRENDRVTLKTTILGSENEIITSLKNIAKENSDQVE